jgi:(1->4)-alpha-D-glucan 1-alpha-D-glucosylmutase
MTGPPAGYGRRVRVPRSTYRLQINAGFTLRDAAGVLPYLHDLGADWVYLSPLLKAEPGSDHGYDVVDHALVDPDRGGAEGLAAVSAEARRLGMGVLVDIVPNHMGVATPGENRWWWDVLTHGQASEHAAAFDIDWEAGGGRLRIPVVGDDDLKDDGRIGHLQVTDGQLRYHDNAYPIAPGTHGEDPDEVHRQQHYELVSWRRADSELNYRRFFAVNTLAGVRVEDRSVLGDSHAEIRRWCGEGLVDGLRVDHPDGLRDPEAYLDDLGELSGGAYVLVEKILEPGESLSPSWATAGTTGYDALALVDRVLTAPTGEGPLSDLETRLRGGELDWHELVHDTKRAVADGILGSEVRRVAREVPSSGLPTDQQVDALAELVACFPVYRSYLPEGREHLDAAVADARRRRPELAEALDALEPVLADPAQPAAARFQQTTGAVMAKGVEDCAFYRTSRLTSLTEVGGSPAEWSASVEDFHTAMAERQRTWPIAMTATSTHDTKRGEDVRARIAVLAEVPDVWADALDSLLAASPLPDPSFGNLLWQAVVGAWPASRERLHGYAEKAMREAGDRTTWTAPDQAYEQAVHAAVDAAFDEPGASAVLDELVDRLAGPGWSNSLAAKLVALTMPGVPDVYQGSELWEQSLVDPDNRRPVDYGVRREVLARVLGGERPALSPHADDRGEAKLLVTEAALTLRRIQPERFSTYVPVAAHGPAAEHVLAFDRGGALTVATRLPVALARHGWQDTRLELPVGSWTDLLTGRTHDGKPLLAEVLGDYPVALLADAEGAVGQGARS